MFFFLIKLIGQGQMFVKKVMNFFITHPHLLTMEKDSPLNELVMQISMGTIDLSSFDLKKELMNFFLQYADTIIRYATGIAKNIGNFVLSLLFMCFALYFLSEVRAISINVNKRITNIGPSTIPFNLKKRIPPSIEKKISSGCIWIRFCKNIGRKKLSIELIKNPATHKKRMPLSKPAVSSISTPSGSHTNAQPKKGKNELKKVKKDKSSAPSTRKIVYTINAAANWHIETKK